VTMPPRDGDVDAARSPGLGKAAGIALAFAGLTSALVPTQILLSMRVPGPTVWVLWGMLASGATALVVGPALLRARGWAAAVGFATAVSLVGLSAWWAWWSFGHGVLHAMPLLALAASVVALALTAAAGPSVVRTATARKRLRDAGLDLG
jgi:hypothetical protein